MPDVEYPGYGQDLPPLPDASNGSEDVTVEAHRRLAYDRRREGFESAEAVARAERILANLELTTATLEQSQPKATERWRRLTGQR